MKNKIAIITGAVGNLGMATARLFQRAGAKTVLVDRSPDRVREAFKDIADSRSRLLNAKSPDETIAAANAQTNALGRLLVVVENYPNLKANEQFNGLMDELSGTENRIATERMRYNEKVQEYNTSRRQFPANITAKLFSFKDYPFFEAPPAATQAPKVNFSKS